MNDDIAPILDKYEGQDADTILADPNLGRDIALIGSSISKADVHTQERAHLFFERLLDVINKQIDDIKNNLDARGQTMDTIQKLADACIAYSKQNGRKKGN
jgi:hypothetical protein